MKKLKINFVLGIASVMTLARADVNCVEFVSKNIRSGTTISLEWTGRRCVLSGSSSERKRTGQSVIVRRVYSQDVFPDLDNNGLIDDTDLLTVLFSFGKSIKEAGIKYLSGLTEVDDCYLTYALLLFGEEQVKKTEICVGKGSPAPIRMN